MIRTECAIVPIGPPNLFRRIFFDPSAQESGVRIRQSERLLKAGPVRGPDSRPNGAAPPSQRDAPMRLPLGEWRRQQAHGGGGWCPASRAPTGGPASCPNGAVRKPSQRDALLRYRSLSPAVNRRTAARAAAAVGVAVPPAAGGGHQGGGRVAAARRGACRAATRVARA